MQNRKTEAVTEMPSRRLLEMPTTVGLLVVHRSLFPPIQVERGGVTCSVCSIPAVWRKSVRFNGSIKRNQGKGGPGKGWGGGAGVFHQSPTQCVTSNWDRRYRSSHVPLHVWRWHEAYYSLPLFPLDSIGY
jgi:hypothetical protein